MKQRSTFQTIFLTVFCVIAVVSVIVFAKSPAKGSSVKAIVGAHGTVMVWGTFPEGGVYSVLNVFNAQYRDSFSVDYQFHDAKNFDNDIVEALASGRGPDILLLPDDLILRHSDKIELMTWSPAFDQLSYQNTFLQASELYMRPGGTLAIPFAVDPMVMYWNRDLFNNASITQPPQYWDEFLTMAPKLTKRDPKSGDIAQSAISFGEFTNLENAKQIIAMLFLQVGNPIVEFNSKGLFAALAQKQDQIFVANEDVASAFRFFMDFSNPLKNIYSWSRALPNSRDQFINGNLAVYFDYASAYHTLQTKNPHLNFVVAGVPQPRNTKVTTTIAHVYGLSVLKTSKNKATAFIAIQRLLDNDPSSKFATAFSLPPVRRDLLSHKPTDAVFSVLYDAAIESRAWLDPRPELSTSAFQEAVEGVASGRSSIVQAVSKLSQALDTALTPYR